MAVGQGSNPDRSCQDWNPDPRLDTSATVTLKQKGGGKEWTLNVGNDSPDKAFVYVNSSDRPRDVFAVRASSLDSLQFKGLSALRSRRLLDVTEGNAQRVDLKEKGKD